MSQSQPPPDWNLGSVVLPTSKRTHIHGILNVTPDSFSDGGEHFDPVRHPQRAIDDALAMVEAGADIIDVGGESTRPGAQAVSDDEELRRVIPVVTALADRSVVVSIDTTKARVAREAVAAGALIVNDVSAGSLDEGLLPTVASLGCGYVLMHMQGTPRTMQNNPTYDDVVADIHQFLADKLAAVVELGIDRTRVAVDPGIGFGKTVAHNIALLRGLGRFTSLGCPILFGASRKSFLGHLTGAADVDDRLEASLAAAVIAAVSGAAIVRVHDVSETVRAIAIADAVVHGVADDTGHGTIATAPN